MKKHILFFLLVLFSAQINVFSQDKGKKILPEQPYIVLNIKESDCQNCSLMALNKLRQIKNKEKSVLLFEDIAQNYLENTFEKLLTGSTVVYDKDLSKLFDNGFRNSLLVVSNNKLYNYKIQDLSDSILNLVNNLTKDTPKSESNQDKYVPDIYHKYLTQNSFFFTDNYFGLFDFTRQKSFIFPDNASVFCGLAEINNELLNSLRMQTFDKSFDPINDSLQNFIIDQTGFSKFAVETLVNNNKHVNLGLNIRTLIPKNTSDTVQHLKLSNNYFIVTSDSLQNVNDLLTLGTKNQFYQVSHRLDFLVLFYQEKSMKKRVRFF